MASLFDMFGKGSAAGNVLGGVRNAVIDPTFLAGAGLVSGGGWGGAMQGASLGQGIQENDRKTASRQQFAKNWGPLVQGIKDPQMKAYAEALGPEESQAFLGQAIARQQAEAADAARRAKDEAFDREKWGTQKGLIEAQTNAANATASRREVDQNDPRVRAAMAQQYGLDPNSDAGRAFILTGKLPREDQMPMTAVEKKAVLEADELVAANQESARSYQTATVPQVGPDGKPVKGSSINDQAYDGWFAGARAAVGNNLPDAIVPNFIADPDRSKATADLDNLATGNALNSLKATFGASPTEGERAILLELQGSSGKPRAVREGIYQRAKVLAEKRAQINAEKASALRGQQYFKPGGQPGGSRNAQPKITSDADYNALPSGTQFVDPNGNLRVKP